MTIFQRRILRIDHCDMGGKASITHFLQFSATFGPQEVEPSHDIYIYRIVTHILSTLRFLSYVLVLSYVLFQFLVDRIVYFHYCITLRIICTALKKCGLYCQSLLLYCSFYYMYCSQKPGL